MPEIFNTMDLMTPSKGYWLQVSDDCTLVYNDAVSKASPRDEYSPWDIAIYPNNSAVIYAEFATNAFNINHTQDYLGVFANGQCLGSGMVNLYSDGITNKNVAVIVAQVPSSPQNLSFAYYRADSDETIFLDQELTVTSGSSYGQVADELVQINHFITDNENNVIESIENLLVTTGNNPFQDRLTLKLESKESQDVEIDLYNLRGQKVASKISKIKSKEIRTIAFNTEKFASGIYFVKVKSCGKISTLKLLKIK